MSSEVHMKMAPPESLAQPSYYGPPPHHHHGWPPPPAPLDPALQKSRRRLTVWSWIALVYTFLNIGAAVIAIVLALTVVLGSLALAYSLGDGGVVLSILLIAMFGLWMLSIPAAGVVGLACGIRAGRLHRQLQPLGHSARMPHVVGWIAFGLSALITLVLIAQAVTILGTDL